MPHARFLRTSLAALALVLTAAAARAQDDAAAPVRGSIVEDRAAKKLLEAGDVRFEADETTKAVEIWQSVIERYPRSGVRFDAHMRLGNYLLERDRAYDKARYHFEQIAAEENSDQDQRAEATLKIGVCYFEARNYGKCFQVMRDVIEKFPVSGQVNQAYYYIGLGHFQLGHYSRAIQALEKVGTALAKDDASLEKVEAGKRLFVKIEDADLAALAPGESVKVKCTTTHGDEEIVECIPVGRNVRVVLGSILTQLGKPRPRNGTLEVQGDAKVEATYVDRHTADKQFNRPVLKTVTVVGNANVQIMDGAYRDTLQGVVLGKEVNVQVTDADLDLSDNADSLKATLAVLREKTSQEIEAEVADLITKGEIAAPQNNAGGLAALDEADRAKIDRYKLIDEAPVTLTEAKIQHETPKVVTPAKAAPAPEKTQPDAAPTLPGAPAQPDKPILDKPDDTAAKELLTDIQKEAVDNTIHSGVFRATVPIVKADEPTKGDDHLQARPGDVVRLSYVDTRHTGADQRKLAARAKAVEGNIGGVRVTRTEITDQELRLKTRLKTASALTNIGNRYKEFGLKEQSTGKYEQALQVCEEITSDARKLGGRILEETYVQLWRIYFEMDQLNLAAAMAQRLQREFPESGFVDEALLQLALVEKKKGDLKKAVSILNRLVNMKTSQLRGEAQFYVAECYEDMAKAATGPQGEALYDRAFQEYKLVFDRFPDSGRVGEAVAKMANFYYQRKDYSRAIDVFETVLQDHPDAKFLDVILFNYGRCLYRMERKAEARRQFDQLIAEFPESTLAPDAKRITEALAKSGF